VVAAVRERFARADGRARRQLVFHIHAVRYRRGGRLAYQQNDWPAAAVRHAVSRHRTPERRSVLCHRMVLTSGILYQVIRLYSLLLKMYF